MKKLLLLLVCILFVSCSYKVVPVPSSNLNPIKPIPGMTVVAVKYDAINFGITSSTFREKVEAQYPDCVGIYMPADNVSNVLYVFVKN